MKYPVMKLTVIILLSCAVLPAWAGNTRDNNTHANACYDTEDSRACGDSIGMPTYSFKSLLAGLSIDDTPLAYKPPVGSKMAFTLTYNATESDQPATFEAVNLGPKWTMNWITYIQDDPDNPGNRVKRYLAGGGAVLYTGYNANTGRFEREDHSAAQLVRVSAHPIVYELRFSDGSKAVFAASNGSQGYPRRVFLTKRVDAQGHVITLHYDAVMRLTGVTDAIGQTSTFQYHNPAFPKRITGITDPFGRHITFEYDHRGRLAAITDAISMTSTFTYNDGTFMTSMTTPYGTTTFARNQGTGLRASIQATGPLGHAERTEFRHNAPGVAYSEPAAPAEVRTNNRYLNYRNSFYWNKLAYARACRQAADGHTFRCDYNKARIKHFLHNNDASSQTARVLESIKYPLESRVRCDSTQGHSRPQHPRHPAFCL